MPPTPTRLGHPLSFLSPVSPGFPSHLTPSLQVSREGHRQQSNLITPQIFDTKIRIESQMFDCKHTHPLRAREDHRKQSNLTTPKMFVTKIRIESQMFDFLHILEIPPPTQGLTGPQTTVQRARVSHCCCAMFLLFFRFFQS